MHLPKGRRPAQLVIAAALAVALGGAGAAWACTPQATSTFFVPDGAGPGAVDVKVEGARYTHELIDGNADADEADSGVPPVLIEIRVGQTIEDAMQGEVLHSLRGPSYSVTIRVDTPGWNYYWVLAHTMNGDFASKGAKSFARRVVEPPAVIVDPPEVVDDGLGTQPPAQEGDGVISPVEGDETATPPAEPSDPASAADPPPGRRGAGRLPEVSPSGGSVGPAPLIGAGPSSAVGSPGRPAGGSTLRPAVEEPGVPAVPVANDLWSGLDVSAPSLLDGAATSPGGVTRLPVGALLLGIGLLVLAGTGAVTGERLLALARNPRA